MRNTTSLAWVTLLFAGLCEVLWAVLLKYTNGFTRPFASALCVLGMILSVVFLERAVRVIPLGTAYAVWTGIGAVGTAILGMILFGESRQVPRLLCIALVVIGVLSLKWTGKNG